MGTEWRKTSTELSLTSQLYGLSSDQSALRGKHVAVITFVIEWPSEGANGP